ncbi:hypothetical protein ILUMI_09592 [Ignelater luminosus]|uniref:Retinol dehydrogenase 11 n=1 Tax=Ignelater luminosus TaxID=2038154 RepID=A0A8K0D8V3_IGNLU|nr:hypothetical protein ILUMI_09592 [Ignelater luminosus]
MKIFSAKCTSTVRLDGKTAIVTGSNTGIGKMTALDFYKRGARVIMACRNMDKANEALEDIKNQCQGLTNVGDISIKQLDLMSLESVRNCADEILKTEERIDLLINNAGVMTCPEGKTKDGFETHFGTNHLGHFLFTLLLLPKIIKSTPARIVNVSSLAHIGGYINFDDLNFEKRSYSAILAYTQSKLANILFTKELASRLKDANIEAVTVYSLHPGVIATDLGRHLDEFCFWGAQWCFLKVMGMFIKTPEQGAQTTIYCAVDENAAKETGLYYAECEVTEPSAKAKNMRDAEKLWSISLKLVGLDDNYNPFA